MVKRQLTLGILFCSLALICCLSPLAQAQTITATINGTIKDDFGQKVANAKLTLKDENQNIVATATSDNEGRYQIDNLAIGSYKMVVESEGLNSETVEDIKLSAASEVTFDLVLQLNLEGRAIKKVAPVYPELAKRTRQEGRVVVGIMVKPDGTVEKALFLNGNTVFKAAALQAVQRWVFQKTNSGITGRIAFVFKL